MYPCVVNFYAICWKSMSNWTAVRGRIYCNWESFIIDQWKRKDTYRVKHRGTIDVKEWYLGSSVEEEESFWEVFLYTCSIWGWYLGNPSQNIGICLLLDRSRAQIQNIHLWNFLGTKHGIKSFCSWVRWRLLTDSIITRIRKEQKWHLRWQRDIWKISL